MSGIGRIMHKIWALMVEGKGIRQNWKNFWKALWKAVSKVWKKFWKEIDRILGILAREVLKLKTPIVKNKVFFHTQENRYACNQKYICEELLRSGLDVDIVWRGPNKGTGGIPDTVRMVRAGSFDYYKEIFSSNVVITNSVLFVDQAIYLKKKQTLIETWHGSLGIKNFGKFDYKSGWRWVRGALATGRMTDYCITNSTFVSGSLRRTYWEKTPMMEFGHPRNDLFLEANKERRDELRAALCEKWGVDPDTKFIMYGPTFRDAHNFDCYDVDFDRLVEALKERFGGSWAVLLRYHPSLEKFYKSRGLKSCVVKRKIERPASEENTEPAEGVQPAVEGAPVEEYEELYRIINVTGYTDMQELIAVTDVAISDYSSWIFDFMLLRRPGFIFATDIALYNNERGFNYPLETTPFPIAVNNDELVENVLHFDNEKYLSELEAFLEDKGCVEDGHASERVVELIKQIIEK